MKPIEELTKRREYWCIWCEEKKREKHKFRIPLRDDGSDFCETTIEKYYACTTKIGEEKMIIGDVPCTVIDGKKCPLK